MQLDTYDERYGDKYLFSKKVWEYLMYNCSDPDFYIPDIIDCIGNKSDDEIIEILKEYERKDKHMSYKSKHPETDMNHPRKLWGPLENRRLRRC